MKDRSVLIQVLAHRYNQVTLPDNKVSLLLQSRQIKSIDRHPCIVCYQVYDEANADKMFEQCVDLSPAPSDYVS
jgi:hypothetical protein